MPYPTRYPTLDLNPTFSDTTPPTSYSVLLISLLVFFHHRFWHYGNCARSLSAFHKQGALMAVVAAANGFGWKGRRSDDLNAMDEIVIAINQSGMPACMHTWEVFDVQGYALVNCLVV
jgi:hypothetical protein